MYLFLFVYINQLYINYIYNAILQELPSLASLSLSTDQRNEGEYLQLSCIVTKGDLPITFFWTLNNRSVSNALATTLNVGRQTR